MSLPPPSLQIRGDAADQLARMRGWTESERELVLREAETRHNTAAALAAAAADSAFQSELAVERARAEEEARRRCAAEAALEVGACCMFAIPVVR